MGSRVEGRLFLGEENMGIPGEEEGEGTQEAESECLGRRRSITGGRAWMSLDICSVLFGLQLRASGVLGKLSLPFS